MTPLDCLLIAFCIAATSIHIGTSLLAMHRCRRGNAPLPAPEGAPAVSILRPVRGVDSTDELTLASGFGLDYPDYELIFCCADHDDPAAALDYAFNANITGPVLNDFDFGGYLIFRGIPTFDWSTRCAPFPNYKNVSKVLCRFRRKWARFRYLAPCDPSSVGMSS